jgi:hypothetical protein
MQMVFSNRDKKKRVKKRKKNSALCNYVRHLHPIATTDAQVDLVVLS